MLMNRKKNQLMIIKTKILAYLCEGPVHNNLYLLGTPGQNYMLEEAKTEK
jgi:hypothetical protein